MSRDLTSLTNAEFTAAFFRPVIFFEGQFDGGYVRLWSGIGTITWNSQSWTGVGYLGGVSPITETGEIQARGFTVSLSGIPSSYISTALSSARQGMSGQIWVGALDASGNVIADPYAAAVGRLDVPEISDTGDTATITISYESRLIDLERPRDRRFTHEDQQIDYAGDMGFEFIPAMQDRQIVWGRG